MIHYGKNISGDLSIIMPPEDVGEVFDLLHSAGLLQRRTFNGLKDYLLREYGDDIDRYRRRVTAQIPTSTNPKTEQQ